MSFNPPSDPEYLKPGLGPKLPLDFSMLTLAKIQVHRAGATSHPLPRVGRHGRTRLAHF